jgi:hypothetical protein
VKVCDELELCRRTSLDVHRRGGECGSRRCRCGDLCCSYEGYSKYLAIFMTAYIKDTLQQMEADQW